MDKIIESLQKDFGKDKVFRGDESPEMDVISTGSISLDFATGVGGIPKGTIVEIFGRESSGKTSLSYYMISEEQKRGGYCAFINLEGRFDPMWAKKIAGIDLNKLIVVSPDPGTEAIEVLAKLVNSGGIDLVVFDSIGAMLGDKEQDAEQKKQAGGQSALVTHMVKLIGLPAYRNQCSVVFLNQVRDIFESMYRLEESPGGHAVKHMASMRIHIKPGKDKVLGIVNGEKIQIMQRMQAKIKKNKVGPPNQVAGWNFWNYPSPEGIVGIDSDQEVLDLAMKLGIIARSGKWYYHDSFPGGKLEGGNNVETFLRSNEAGLTKVKGELKTYWPTGASEGELRETLV